MKILSDIFTHFTMTITCFVWRVYLLLASVTYEGCHLVNVKLAELVSGNNLWYSLALLEYELSL